VWRWIEATDLLLVMLNILCIEGFVVFLLSIYVFRR